MDALPRTTAGDYCREIEAHLCRLNEGHLVRIVGPVFERVCRWHERGIPLKVVFKGVERTVAREKAKGPRRRPVRVEFCEADVLDAFDEWRRAVGVGMRPGADVPGEAGSGRAGAGAAPAGRAPLRDPPRRRAPALRTHIDRALARLTQCRLDAATPGPLQAAIDAAVAALDDLRAAAHGARGAARDAVTAALAREDEALVRTAHDVLSDDRRAALAREAARELEPFAARMTPEALGRARGAVLARLVREAWRLPDLTGGL